MTSRLALALAVCGLLTPVSVAQTNSQASERGASWLQRQSISTAGQQADAIVALAAAGRAPASLKPRLSRLETSASSYAVTAGATGKVVLAVVAAGGDPTSFGGVNLVARIESQYASGRYGVSSYDQAYAMLALRAAGERLPAAAPQALRATRGNGGWGFTLRTAATDDVSATGLVIEAMRAGGVPAGDPALRAATAWMLAQRNRQGGFAIAGKGGPTEANSTAIALRALRAMGRTPPAATTRELRRLQEADGGFRFTARIRENRMFATVDAVVALSGHTLTPPFGG